MYRGFNVKKILKKYKGIFYTSLELFMKAFFNNNNNIIIITLTLELSFYKLLKLNIGKKKVLLSDTEMFILLYSLKKIKVNTSRKLQLLRLWVLLYFCVLVMI